MRIVMSLGLLLLLGAGVFHLTAPPEPEWLYRPPPTPTVATSLPPAEDASPASSDLSNAMAFNASPAARAPLHAVERVVGEGNMRVATRLHEGRRWFCILTDGSGRYATMDGGKRLADWPGLAAQGFSEPPGPVARSMSTCRSVAAQSVEHDVEAGDRLLVLTCPKAEWDDLRLAWPPGTTPTDELEAR